MAEQVSQHGHQDHAYPQTGVAVSLLLVFPLAILLFVLRRSSATARAREKLLSSLPSPPRKLPIIGHLHLMGSLPHFSLRDLASKHGRDGFLLLRLGTVPTLVVSSPSAAEAVLRTHDHIFASRPHSFVSDTLFYGSVDIAFSPYGEHWRKVRKIATMHLLTAKKVQSYRLAREQEVSLVLAKISEASAARKPIDLSDLLNAFGNDIVCQAVSGKFFREEGRNELFRELVDANSRLLGEFNPVEYLPILGKLGIVRRMFCAKAEKVHKVWDDLLSKLIDDHASKPVSQVDSEDSDFIDVLLSVQDEFQLTRDDIKAQLEVLFEAGTDTSSLILEYAMAELMLNPNTMNKLQAELRTAIPQGKKIVTQDDLNGLPYLQAVIKETLRLHPPVPLLVPHFSTADCDIGGYTIPAETRTIINIWALARDPNYWECAEEFMPERFMEGGRAAAMDYMGNDFMYLPFGSGRRRCPGISFGVPTVEVMLANLIYHFNWELPPESAEKGIDMTDSFGVTLHRIEKLLLVPVPPQN